MKNNILAILCLLALLRLPAQNNDSLIGLLKTNLPDTVRLQLLTDLNWNFLGIDVDKANDFATQELQLAMRINNQQYVAQAYNDQGLVLMRRNNFKAALAKHREALAIRLKLPSLKDRASSYSKIGVCCTELSDYAEALQADLQALSIFEKLQMKPHLCTTLTNICGLYAKIKDFKSVAVYAKRAYAVAKEIDVPLNMARAIHYMSWSYESEGNIQAAIRAEQEALQLFTQIEDSSAMSSTLNNIGYYYRQMHQDAPALAYYLKALHIAELINDASGEMIYNRNAGDVYRTLGDMTASEKYFKKAEQIGKAQLKMDDLVYVYKGLGTLYALTGRGKEADAYFKLYDALKDSLFSQQLSQQISDMQVKYDSEKKEADNLLLQDENALKTAQLGRSRAIQVSLIVGLLLVIAISWLLYNRSQLKQKQQLAAERLQQQELRSHEVLEAEERERTRIARDLHDGIGQQLSAARLNIAGLQSRLKLTGNDEEVMLQHAIDLLDDSVKEVGQVSHSMMANALLKSGLAAAVREFIYKISGAGHLKVNLEIIGLESRLEHVTELVLFRIFQEMVNNIIRHAQASQVTIQLIRHDTELTLLVEDNGTGFEMTKAESEGGVGLKNIRSRVAFLNGQVFFDSFPGKGTTVTIEVPL